MKMRIKLPLLLLTVVSLLFVGCKKDKAPVPAPEFTKFYLSTGSHPGLAQEVTGVIEGKTISLRIPNTVNLAQAKPSFEVSAQNAIVYVGSEVQQSGSTVQDLSSGSVKYRIVSESGTTEYTINALRNAAILTYGFYAEDNDGVLFKDYVAEINGLNIQVKLPVDAKITELVGRFTTTPNATVKSGATTQESKVTKNNFTNPVKFSVSDAQSTTSDEFTVTVSRLTAPEWTVVPNTGLSTKLATLRLAIHPVTNQPYVTYTLPTSAVGTDDANKRKAVAAYFDQGTWKTLGSSEGFSAGRSDLSSITIGKNGTVYVAYKDWVTGAGAQKASVQKFENNSWSYVGAQQFTDHAVNHLSIAIGSDQAPVLGYVLASAGAGLPSRAPFAYQFSGNTWQARPMPSITTSYFARTFTGNDGKIYSAQMDMTPGVALRQPTLLKLNNGTWQTVGNALITPAVDVFGAILIDAAVAEDGKAYLVFQSQPNADKKSYVMHYDGTKWEQIGDFISHTASSNGERDNIALAIHPNGTLYFAHGDATGLYVTTFNETTNNWNAMKQIRSSKIDKIDLKISNDGIPYLAAEDTENSAAVIYKFDIPAN